MGCSRTARIARSAGQCRPGSWPTQRGLASATAMLLVPMFFNDDNDNI